MLDTNIIVYAKNRRSERVVNMLLQHKPRDICISMITMAELEYGVYKSSRPAANRLALITFLSGFQIVPFDANAAREYGDIRTSLEKRGVVISGNDMLIAAQARALGSILVTNNQREFERIEGLEVENWA